MNHTDRMNKENKYQLKRESSLSAAEEEVGRAVVNAAFYVHKTLGPGLLERVYEVCFCHILTEKGFRVERFVTSPLPHRSGRAELPHPVPLLMVSLKELVYNPWLF